MYKVIASLRADLNEGWIWHGKKNIVPRSVVRITNRTARKKVYCETLEIDDNYINEYNCQGRFNITQEEKNNIIAMNGWYRVKLGIENTREEYDLEIKCMNNILGKVLAGCNHPQLVSRLSIKLAIWSVVLGFFGIIFGMISMFCK